MTSALDQFLKDAKADVRKYNGSLVDRLRPAIKIIEALENGIRQSIARADDYGDSHCSQPIRQAIDEANKIAGGEK